MACQLGFRVETRKPGKLESVRKVERREVDMDHITKLWVCGDGAANSHVFEVKIVFGTAFAATRAST